MADGVAVGVAVVENFERSNQAPSNRLRVTELPSCRAVEDAQAARSRDRWRRCCRKRYAGGGGVDGSDDLCAMLHSSATGCRAGAVDGRNELRG
jgi:hypothetical protein